MIIDHLSVCIHIKRYYVVGYKKENIGKNREKSEKYKK